MSAGIEVPWQHPASRMKQMKQNSRESHENELKQSVNQSVSQSASHRKHSF